MRKRCDVDRAVMLTVRTARPLLLLRVIAGVPAAADAQRATRRQDTTMTTRNAQIGAA
jgi:hypothetical protein